jgi:hypothetical protein
MLAREYFIIQSRRESYKSYINFITIPEKNRTKHGTIKIVAMSGLKENL